jgi:hypothetical protein
MPVIVRMYIAALHMPASSPCMSGERSTCIVEMKAVLADKSQTEAIRGEVEKMLASVKTN